MNISMKVDTRAGVHFTNLVFQKRIFVKSIRNTTTQICNEMHPLYTVRRAHVHNFVSCFRQLSAAGTSANFSRSTSSHSPHHGNVSL